MKFDNRRKKVHLDCVASKADWMVSDSICVRVGTIEQREKKTFWEAGNKTRVLSAVKITIKVHA